MRQPNGKFRYNCSIIDLYDWSAIASVNGDYINTQLAIDTLTQALEKEKYPSVVLHSDQGYNMLPGSLLISVKTIMSLKV